MRALIIDGKVIEFPSDFLKYKQRFNISLRRPITDADYERLGLFRVVEADQPVHNKRTQELKHLPLPEMVDGVVVWGYEVKELSNNRSVQAHAARSKRVTRSITKILRETDHLLLPDTPLDAAQIQELTSYRQALRDFPSEAENMDFIRVIDLPITPDFLDIDDIFIFNIRDL